MPCEVNALQGFSFTDPGRESCVNVSWLIKPYWGEEKEN